jgi:polysaccharide pyruvyl transferase WcaK-like protein
MRESSATAPSVVVLGDMRDLHHHGCSAVMCQLANGLAGVGLPPDLFVPGLDWNAARTACLTASLVVINGEGALHHSRPAIAQILALAEARRALGRPTALVNSSWFDNDPALTRRLSAFDLVVLRDPQSLRAVGEAGVAASLVPDLAIRQALRFHEGRSTAAAATGLMVSDSTKPKLTRQLTRLAATRGWTYLPVLARPDEVRPGAKSRKIRQRYQFARLLGPLARHVLSPRHHAHLVGEPTLDAYCRRLAAAEGVVTGRFHTVCLALGLRVPLLAVASNTPKIEALLTDAGLDLSRRVLAPEKLAAITGVPAYTAAESAALDTFLSRADHAYADLFARIRSLLPAPPATHS